MPKFIIDWLSFNTNSMSISTFLKSVIIWLIPFLVSFVFYDQSGNLVGNFWVFKLTMIVVFCLTTYFTFRNYYKTHSDWLATVGIILGVNVLLDLIVLVGMIKMPAVTWVTQVMPVYLVIVPVVHYFLSRKLKGKPTH
jgi:hypothetical protein